jgi:hypothetical protein
MIPDWATHYGTFDTGMSDCGGPGSRICREELQVIGGGRLRDKRHAKWRVGETRGTMTLISVRPITPEMRREALAAEVERLGLIRDDIRDKLADAERATIAARLALTAFDREHGAGE